MVSFPNAKINLGLNVVKKRRDGYHDIESVFYPLDGVSFDVLEVINGPSDLKLSGLKVSGSIKDNLCMKVYDHMRKEFKTGPLKVLLHKNIPAGAGLGGGSADAAFLIRMMNEKFQIGLAEKKMETIAARFGSDCAFFIRNQPALATGRGEILKPIPVSLKGYFIKLICPDIHVSTQQAYSMIRPGKSQYPIKQIIKLPVSKWKNKLINDFEEPVFKMHPELSKIKAGLYSEGAVYASMSGSGSTVFGLFTKKPGDRVSGKNRLVQVAQLT